MISRNFPDFASRCAREGYQIESSIEEMAAYLAREEHRLDRLRASIDLNVLNEDLATLQELKRTENSVNELKQETESHTHERDRLETERYDRFSNAMATINKRCT